MSSPSPRDVAEFMLKRLNEDQILYQNQIVYEIAEKFGDDFFYTNQNGNLGIDRNVLAEFRKLTEDKVVWSRGERYWRFIEDYDDPGSRMTDY
jgi:hypothetical protein